MLSWFGGLVKMTLPLGSAAAIISPLPPPDRMGRQGSKGVGSVPGPKGLHASLAPSCPSTGPAVVMRVPTEHQGHQHPTHLPPLLQLVDHDGPSACPSPISSTASVVGLQLTSSPPREMVMTVDVGERCLHQGHLGTHGVHQHPAI